MQFINFLRVLRGFAGLCLVLAAVAIVVQLLNNFWHFDFLMPSTAAITMLAFMHIAFWLWAFIGLRRIIHSVHEQTFGHPHPRLRKPWHL
ncbi:hypothetical protein [Aliidiomarina maris]|uniref:Uncharacterized protein n=1 Tax=Aliidiomarina maris TaxID=531312 RepID=A0A327WVD3_9GAMM|nr:hypothetical protein [Aliidiomarina maris]RAJ96946.1 hypothetical protein B0I24_1069 [Aliidiomarina maris]RUO24557.1 hypothetical protein CWE07_07745 [Aliidiomarina maris]